MASRHYCFTCRAWALVAAVVFALFVAACQTTYYAKPGSHTRASAMETLTRILESEGKQRRDGYSNLRADVLGLSWIERANVYNETTKAIDVKTTQRRVIYPEISAITVEQEEMLGTVTGSVVSIVTGTITMTLHDGKSYRFSMETQNARDVADALMALADGR